jgi:hypothetical protein
MRYYMTQQIASSYVVVGEIIGRTDPRNGSSIPNGLADDRALTREQLLEQPGGRQALWAWERGDDAPYSRAMEEWMRKGDIEEVRMLAGSGNRWAQELVSAGLPDEDVQAFLGSDCAVTGGLQLLR